MAHPRKALALVPLLFLCLAVALPAQAAGSTASSGSAAAMRDGITQFRNSQFEKAIPLFRTVIQDPLAGLARSEAYLLIAKSYMAVGKLADAGSALDSYLASYPGGPDISEVVYQKGRLLFMQESFEASLQLLQSFIASYPKSPFLSSAWFWAGECLYGLGRLDDAQAVYSKILADFPTSVKVEASRYKLELIKVRRKELELELLLKWSHEELLRTVEDSHNREKAYEQALEAYQKRLASSGTPDDPKIIADLRTELAKKNDEAAQLSAGLAQKSDEAAQLSAGLAQKTGEAAELSAGLARKTDEAAQLSAQLAAADAAAEAAVQKAEQLARLQETLAAKAAALELKERYLGQIDAGAGGAGN